MVLLEKNENKDLMNRMFPGRGVQNIGRWIDRSSNAKRVIAATERRTKVGTAKIGRECSVSLTPPRCVNLIVTDIEVIEVTED